MGNYWFDRLCAEIGNEQDKLDWEKQKKDAGING